MLSPMQKSKSKAKDLKKIKKKEGKKRPFQFIEAKQLLSLFPK